MVILWCPFFSPLQLEKNYSVFFWTSFPSIFVWLHDSFNPILTQQFVAFLEVTFRSLLALNQGKVRGPKTWKFVSLLMAASGAVRKVFGVCLVVVFFPRLLAMLVDTLPTQPMRKHVLDVLDILKQFKWSLILKKSPWWTSCAGSGRLMIPHKAFWWLVSVVASCCFFVPAEAAFQKTVPPSKL